LHQEELTLNTMAKFMLYIQYDARFYKARAAICQADFLR
jgi:hypothetical protein